MSLWPPLHRAELDNHELSACREAFAKVPSGRIDNTFELRNALALLGQQAIDEELDDCLRLRGWFDFQDFVMFIEQQKMKYLQPPEDSVQDDARGAFEAMGGETDGKVSTEILRNTCKEFRLTIDIDKLIEQADANGSGYVDFDEFKAMWESRTPTPTQVKHATPPRSAEDRKSLERKFTLHHFHALQTLKKNPNETDHWAQVLKNVDRGAGAGVSNSPKNSSARNNNNDSGVGSYWPPAPPSPELTLNGGFGCRRPPKRRYRAAPVPDAGHIRPVVTRTIDGTGSVLPSMASIDAMKISKTALPSLRAKPKKKRSKTQQNSNSRSATLTAVPPSGGTTSNPRGTIGVLPPAGKHATTQPLP